MYTGLHASYCYERATKKLNDGSVRSCTHPKVYLHLDMRATSSDANRHECLLCKRYTKLRAAVLVSHEIISSSIPPLDHRPVNEVYSEWNPYNFVLMNYEHDVDINKRRVSSDNRRGPAPLATLTLH